MDDIPKTITWVLGGSSVVAALLSLIGLAPRLVGAYPQWVQAAIGCIVLGLASGCAATIFYILKGTGDTPVNPSREAKWRHCAIISVAVGLISTLTATAILAVSYATTLRTPDVPRLALSVSDANQPDVATVKVKFEADGLHPGIFLVVDIIGVATGTSVRVGFDQFTPGHRVYRAAIGSDANGQITSEIQTNIHRKDYRVVVAQVYPGPLSIDNRAPNNTEASTKLCSDIVTKEVRSCAYAEVPQ